MGRPPGRLEVAKGRTRGAVLPVQGPFHTLGPAPGLIGRQRTTRHSQDAFAGVLMSFNHPANQLSWLRSDGWECLFML